ncbi:MAG: RNA methyltransferase [Sphingomonadaceae bacterium]|nr:RNA methyltransferase [Sphingomonadaceae bacterium]
MLAGYDTSAAPLQPAVVLVRPQLGANIGAAARAMLNFGMIDLRLVAPRDGWPNPDAGPSASGADAVLAQSRVFGTIAEATADCHLVIATAQRPRDLTKLVHTPRSAAAAVRAEPTRSALLFGPERTGLLTDELALAGAILSVPTNPDFGSLNLAQAVLLVAYEWASAADPGARLNAYDGPASAASVDALVDHVERELERAGYFRVITREAATRRTLRNLLTRPAFSEKEVRTLRGVISTLTGERLRARGGEP